MPATKVPGAAKDVEVPLIFHWAQRREISLALPAFLILSVLVHAATFYVFQVTYPQNVTLTPPPAEVVLLSAAESSAAYWQRTQEEDPALLLRPVPVDPPEDLRVRYQPSFLESSMTPQLVDAASRVVPMPEGQVAASYLAAARPPITRVSQAPGAFPTAFTFSPSLQALLPMPLPSLKIVKPSPQNLETTTFYVGIRANGAMGYLFLESSSGDPRMDRQAEEFLMTLPYRRGDGRVTWGFATVRWGVDAMRANGNEPF